MSNASNATRLPVIFVTHGGGPLPLLGDPTHAPLTRSLQQLQGALPQGARPRAIVRVTAHGETSWPTVSTHPQPPMLYDYGGVPPEAYQVRVRMRACTWQACAC